MGKVPVFRPGEKKVKRMAKGGTVGRPYGRFARLADGGTVPGDSEYPGEDTELDDTEPFLLSPGEIVVPKTRADNPNEAAAFAANEAAKKKKKTGVTGMLDSMYLKGTPKRKDS
jgi:hypothetical protein